MSIGLGVREKKKTKKHTYTTLSKKKWKWIYLFLLPQAVMFLVFTLWPIIASYYFSFFQWDGIGWPHNFIGFQNFKEVATDQFFWQAFKNSFIYMVILVIIVVPSSLLVAMLLNSPKLKMAGLFKTIYFLPIVATTAIIGIVMSQMFATQGGFVNGVLMFLHIIHQPIDWLGSGRTAMAALIMVGIWKAFGLKVIYWLAALQTLPKDVYEAAEIDGSNKVHRFFYITVPLLVPFFLIITFFQVIWSLNVFDLVRTFTNGGPYNATNVVPLYIYQNAFTATDGLPRMGFASSAGIFYGVTTMIISVGMGWLIKKFSGRSVSE